ncbi:MAG: SAM-dependent methyltransferase [Elusimicrobia bacterium]|nr:SAM-dependent methyltransferase [Elusimicrobiota bacterium]
MKDNKSSKTAIWVAVCRSIANIPVGDETICNNPVGIQLVHGKAKKIINLIQKYPNIFWKIFGLFSPAILSVFWIKLRTRVIDDILLKFVEEKGEQLIILGAGYDFRAETLKNKLKDIPVFEVDHPATQNSKRRFLKELGMSSSNVRYIQWDFERNEISLLGNVLKNSGFDKNKKTLIIWEGVIMYLTEQAVSNTLQVLSNLMSKDSLLVFEYFQKESIKKENPISRLISKIGVQKQEPFKFGWQPEELPGWFENRGFKIEKDMNDEEIGNKYLNENNRSKFKKVRKNWRFHLAIAGLK